MIRPAVKPVLIAALLPWCATPVMAVSVEDVDTTYWRCRFCPDPSGLQGEVEAGIGTVSDDNTQFGRYNGLDEEGLYGLASADLTWYGEEAMRWDLVARDLGLKSRSLSISGGRQGHYGLYLGYDELYHLDSTTAETPFLGAGSDNLTLPSGWTRGSTTGQMTLLSQSLRPTDIATERNRFNVGAFLQSASRWSFHWDVKHEEREGERWTGGTFITNAAELLEPVDDTTSILTTGVGYQGEGWQLGLDYKGSFYSNQSSALTWDNPYASLSPGDDRGQKALSPDNQFHQLNVQGVYRFSQRAVLSGNVAAGRMIQDDDFLAPSVNTALALPALPAEQADARVNTLTANARLTWAPPVSGLSSVFSYRGRWHDNDTPEKTFTQVITDTYIGSDRQNAPLSYRRQTLEGQLRYRLRRGQRLSGGVEMEDYQRDYAADARTLEYTLWGKWQADLTAASQLRLKAARSWRNGKDNQPATVTASPQNPAMTWFDIVDRTRDQFRAALSVFPTQRVSATFSAEFEVSDYHDNPLGRTEDRERSLGFDLSATPRDDLTVYAYYAWHLASYEQRNSVSTVAAAWDGTTEDRFDTFGLGGKLTGLNDKIDLAADITLSDSTGSTEVDTGTATPGFPDFTHRRLTVSLRGDYRLTDNTDLGLKMAYEKIRDYDDWHLDGVDPATVPRLLSLGRDTDEHELFLTALLVRHRF